MKTNAPVPSPPSLVLIGFGNQAKAWALNLRDSGWKVFIALRAESASRSKVEAMGFSTLRLKTADLTPHHHFALLAPDHTHPEILRDSQDFFPPDATFIYAHGFSWHKFELQKLCPSWTHLLLAPKSIASELRFQYETKGRVSGVYSLENSTRREIDEKFIKGLSRDLGLNVGPFPTTFEKETYADLFSEQSLLCSLVPYACLYTYNLLVEKGIEKELAFLECWHELKLIVDTLIPMGPKKFFDMISPNALVGSQKGKDALLDPHFMKNLENLLNDILQKKFYKDLDHVNYSLTKKDILEFWEKEDFSQVFDRLAPQLYPTLPERQIT